jgi:hypothetical protein
MDYETIVNCFVAVFADYDSDDIRTFVINKDRNDFPDFLAFLINSKVAGDWHLGYNNISFDSQITEYILENQDMLYGMSSDEVTKLIYMYAQSVINRSSKGEFLDYPEFKLSIPVLDIFKLNHWDSQAKRSSLKWIQFSMDWYNVEEMPHEHYIEVLSTSTLDEIVQYCINDVMSTRAIFLLKDGSGEKVMASQINLRAQLSRDYKLRLHSASEPKISKEMFLHFLSEKLKLDKKVLRDMRTLRNHVTVRDVILPYVKFETPEFIGVHNWFKSMVVDTSVVDVEEQERKGPKYSMTYKGVQTDYGLGGLHGCISSGIYEATPGKKILSADVTSFYPNLAIKNKWSPAHISKEAFCELYEWFFIERKKYDKKNPLNYLFKIILNSTYGLSKNRHSFLYDPEFTFRITVNGQLLLSMLYEMIATRIPTAQPLMQNTDGLEFLVDEKDEELFYTICNEWQEMTSLQLEFVEYKKMIIADVNNYIAIPTKGKPKCKGRYEFDNLALHKNKSFLIIPKAWYAYFIDGVDPKDFLANNRNIYDYCAGVKLKGDWHFVRRELVDDSIKETKLQKMLRFYNSNKGCKLIKCHSDGRELQLVSGPHMQTIFNRYQELPWEQYDVDEKFYLDRIYDEIAKVESRATVLPAHLQNNQLSLF